MNSVQMGSAEWAPSSIEVAVIVEAHPDHAQQIGSVAGEPAVVGGAGFAGGGAVNA